MSYKRPLPSFPLSAICILTVVISPFIVKQQRPAQKSESAATFSPKAKHGDRLDAWKIIGPGGGGALFHPAINPLDPNMMLFSCDMGGNYISRDGGATWRMFNLWAQNTFTFDPKNPNVILAAGGGMLWRTENAGEDWHLIFPQPSKVSGINFTDEEGAIKVLTQGWVNSIRTVAFDPEDSGILYAASASNALLSHDGGKSWRSVGNIKGVFKILAMPDKIAYFIARDRVFTFSKGKIVQNPEILPKTWVADAAAGSSDGKSAIYVITPPKFAENDAKVIGGLLVSYDGGTNWAQASGPLFADLANKWEIAEPRAVAVDLHNPDLVYLSFGHLVKKNDPTNTYFGVAKSLDGGKTWAFPWMSTTAHDSANLHDLWISHQFGPDWGENPLSMALDSANPKLVLAGDLGRCLRSSDGGENWYGCYSTMMPDGTFTTTGIDVNVAYGVYFDPFDTNRIFIANTDIGLFRSENAGASWINSNIGVPFRWRNATYSIAFDPSVKGKVWAAMSGTHDLPLARVLHFDPARYKGGVMVSSDGGKSWAKSGSLPEAAYTQVLLELSNRPEGRVLYTTAVGHGVFKSVDSGSTWNLKSDGLPPNPRVWRIAEDSKGTLYVVIVRNKDNGKYGSEDDGALYKSSNGGDHWNRVDIPQGLNGPTDIQVDRNHPNRLYLSAWSRTDPIRSTHAQGGVFVSPDFGKSWMRTLPVDYAFSVTVDPHDSNIVYAATNEAAAWRSTDAGMSWKRIRGFNFKGAHRIIPDPKNPKMIYIATNGGGVWYGPAEGDPTAPEDVATPEVSFTKIARDRLRH